MNDVLNAQDVLDLIDLAVEQAGPDHTASSFYTRFGLPHCIASVVLHRGGMSLSDLESLEGQTIESLWRSGRLTGILSKPAMTVLDWAQIAQDSHCAPWGTVRAGVHRFFDGTAQEEQKGELVSV